MEKWKFITGYNNKYKVSSLGRVKSFKRKAPRLMKLTDNGAGYLVVNLTTVDGRQRSRMVHQLVAIEFLNHKPNGHTIVVDHIDNVKTNNSASNLQLTSVRHNSTKDLKNCSSIYPGVSLCKDNKWSARIYYEGRSHFLGVFVSEVEASKAYHNEAKNL